MASSSHPSATLLPTAPNSPGGLPSYMFEFDMDDSTVFDPQFELPESWGEVGQGEPGGYDDFNPLPPLSFPPLPFTLETEAASSNQFYPPTTLQPLPPAPPPDQLTTSLFSTFESSALSSFLTATLEGEPSPPPLPHHQPSTSSNSSHSFKKSSESAFAGLVKARGAWDFNPVLPKGLPSWKKVGEGVQGVPSLSGLERMRIGEPSSSSRGGRNPGDIGGQSGALVGWPSFAPSEYGSSSSSYRGGGGGGHTSIINSTPLPNGRPSASFSSSSKRPPSTNRRRPSSSSSSRPQQQQQQPPPPSSNTSGSTPSASTPTTLPDTDALMSEPIASRAEEGLVDNSDEIMRGVVRVAGVDEDEGEEELDVDEDGEEISSRGSGARSSTKGKGKRTARSAPTPTPPPSQRDDDFIPPSSSSSRTAAASRNRKRPKHDLPPPTASASTRRTSSTSSSSASSNKLQTPSSPEDTPMQAVDQLPSQPRTNRAPSSVASSASAGGASSSNNNAAEVKQEQQPKGSFGRGLLTAKEKRENHILSEQKRRNAIRSSYAELSLILTSSTLSPLPLALPPSPPPTSSNPAPGGAKKRGGGAKAAKAAGGDVGVGRGGSKSSVLGKAVGLVRWLGEGNEWLEREVERLGGLVGEEGAGGVKMES